MKRGKTKILCLQEAAGERLEMQRVFRVLEPIRPDEEAIQRMKTAIAQKVAEKISGESLPLERKGMARPRAAAACLAVVLALAAGGAVLWLTEGGGFSLGGMTPPVGEGSSSSQNEGENSGSGQQENTSLAYMTLFYQNRRYKSQMEINPVVREKYQIQASFGECLGEVKPLYDAMGESSFHSSSSVSSPSSYPDLTVNILLSGEIYTMQGYDPRFLLCRFQESPYPETAFTFYLCLDDFSISTGKDLFGDLLHLKEYTLGRESGSRENGACYPLPDNWDAFLEELYAAPVATPQEGEVDYKKATGLSLHLQGGICASISLFENGWVEFADMFFRLEGQEYQQVYAYCKGMGAELLG